MQTVAYRADIDGLRGIAVLSVLIYHFFPHLLPGGFVGVDIFFVISGFLITSIILKQVEVESFSFTAFYIRRIKRLFPSLIVVLLFVLGAGWFLLIPSDYESVAKHAVASTFFGLNIILGLELNYFNHDVLTKPLIHLWSLSVEEQFYLLWPLFIFCFARFRFFIWIIIITIAGSFLFNVVYIFENPMSVFYSPFARFWELLIGCVVAIVASHKRIYPIVPAIGIVGIFCAVFFLSGTFVYPGYYALLPVISSAFIILGRPDHFINRSILSWRPLVWVGLISYPLYLWHWPLISFAHLLEGQDLTWQIRFSLLVLSFSLATLSYILLEKPIRRRVHSALVLAILCILMVSITCISFFIYTNKGLDSRIPEQIRALVNKIDFGWADIDKYGSCYKGGPSPTRDDSCIDHKRPMIFLWGDSFAASLYPGIKKLQDTRSFGFTSYTQSGCPPIFRIPVLRYWLDCNETNQEVFGVVGRIKPEILLLYSAWEHLDNFPMSRDEFLQKLQETIFDIRKVVPETKIIIIGPTPRWHGGLQEAIYEDYKLSKKMWISDYVSLNLDDTMESLDLIMQQKAKELGVTYISAYKHMCNETGCLARVGQKPTDLTFIDYGHLSMAGANYLAFTMKDELFNAMANTGKREGKQ